MPSYKLVYFDARGVCEVARFMFAVSATEYEDFRYPVKFGTPGDFSTIIRPEFDKAKADGELDVSLGKLPYLEVDGTKVPQSKAIERYVAGQLGFMGSNPIEAAQIDSLCETVRDFKDAYQKVRGIQDAEEKALKMDKWFSEDLPNHVAAAEKSLPSGPGPFLVGTKMSLADLQWFQFLAAPKGFFDNAEGAKAAYEPCPRIKAAVEAVAGTAEIQAWIAKRPDNFV